MSTIDDLRDSVDESDSTFREGMQQAREAIQNEVSDEHDYAA